jgi:hypothetical protein
MSDPTGIDEATAARIEACCGFTATELLALEDLADKDDVVVYLSGSVVSGHANPWSDIDVFVVTDREPHSDFVMEATTNLVVPHEQAGRRIDFEYWRPHMLDDMARRLAQHEFASGRSIQGATFMQIEVIFMHRVRVGIPLMNAAGFAQLQARFDFDRLAAFLSEESIRRLDGEVEDLIGMRKGGDGDTALWVARQVLDVSVQAYLHSRGNTDPVAKWTVRYLDELAPSADHDRMRDDYWRLSYPGSGASLRSGGWQAYAEEVLEFANRIAALTQG